MKKLAITGLLLTCLPGSVAALEIQLPTVSVPGDAVSFGDDSVSAQSSGSIKSTTSATASSGGNTAGPGGRVRTGDASASASTEIRTDGSGGLVEVRVETEMDGKKYSETITKQLKPGEQINITAATSSKTGGQVGVKAEADTEVTVGVNATSSAEGDSSGSSIPLFRTLTDGFANAGFKTLFVRISSAVRSIFGSLWFF